MLPGGEEETGTRRAPTAVIAVLTVLAVVALGAACAKEDVAVPAATTATTEPEQAPVRGGRLVVAVPGETNGWNPGASQWADAGSMVGSSVMEPLVVARPDGTFQPYLAESVTPNDRLDVWTITVRDGIRFHDGTPLTGEVVKANLDYFRSPAALTGLASSKMFSEIVVTGPRSVEVRLTEPWAAYPNALASGSGWMMASSMLTAPDGGAAHPVGTGPFVFDRWVQDATFTAHRFDGYWQKDQRGQALPYLDQIEFKVIVDAGQRNQALKAGEVDLLLSTKAGDAVALADGYNVIRDNTSEQTLVQLNTGKAPFDDVHARRALALATNREELAAQQGDGVEQSNSPFPASTRWGKAQPAYPTFDAAKAKEEIEAYKKATGAAELHFTLSTLADVSSSEVAQMLQAQWRQVGIIADLETSEQTAFITKVVTGGTQAALMRNYGYTDPDSNYYFFHKSTALGPGQVNINLSELKDDQLSDAMDTGRRSLDPNVRQAAYDKAAERIDANLINIWLFNTPYAIIAKKDVRGLNPAREQGFGNFMPKPWLAALWRAPA